MPNDGAVCAVGELACQLLHHPGELDGVVGAASWWRLLICVHPNYFARIPYPLASVIGCADHQKLGRSGKGSGVCLEMSSI